MRHAVELSLLTCQSRAEDKRCGRGRGNKTQRSKATKRWTCREIRRYNLDSQRVARRRERRLMKLARGGRIANGAARGTSGTQHVARHAANGRGADDETGCSNAKAVTQHRKTVSPGSRGLDTSIFVVHLVNIHVVDDCLQLSTTLCLSSGPPKNQGITNTDENPKNVSLQKRTHKPQPRWRFDESADVFCL